jgi:hypothetical protein
MTTHHPLIAFALSTALGTPGMAAELSVKLEIPQLKAAEYHRPYIAVWLERADQSFAANLAVWYDVKMQNNKGHEWLKDMRQWWRKSGRELQLPVDGLSSATRAPGEHELAFTTSKAPLKDLPAGDYRLVVEAAREVGGRELIAIPFQWPAKAAQNQTATGSHELGRLAVSIKP